MSAYQRHVNTLNAAFSKAFKQEDLLNQPQDAQNKVRRVASTYLLYLGELGKMKAKFDVDTTNTKIT